MTTLRRVAVRISRVVVRLASPGAQDWAKATAREVEFIGSDWAALRWALGSVRVLFGQHDARLESLTQVPEEARRLAWEMRAGTILGTAIALFEAAVFSSFFMHFRVHALLRTGCAMTVAGALWFAWQSIAKRGHNVPCGDRLHAVAAYRSELRRQRDFHSAGQLYSQVGPLSLGMIVMAAGMIFADPKTAVGSISSLAAFFVFALIAAHNYRRRAARLQRRIDELDALVASVEGAG